MLKRKGAPIDESNYADENTNQHLMMLIEIMFGLHQAIRKLNLKNQKIGQNLYGGAIFCQGADLCETVIEEHQSEMEEISPNDIYIIHYNSKVDVAEDERIQELEIYLIKFPTYSSYLNKNQLETLKCYLTNQRPKNEQQLITSLQKIRKNQLLKETDCIFLWIKSSLLRMHRLG